MCRRCSWKARAQVDAVKARLDKGENFTDIAAELSLEKTSKDNKGDFGWVPTQMKKNMKDDFGWTPWSFKQYPQ